MCFRTVYAAVIVRSYPVSIRAAHSSDAFYWHTWGVAAQIDRSLPHVGAVLPRSVRRWMACAYRDCDVVAAVATCAEVQSELDYAAVAGMPISAGSVCPRIGVRARPNYLIFGEGGTASFGAQLRLP